MERILLAVGGAINLLFGVYHFSFWKMFNWSTYLQNMDPGNRGIIQILNIHWALVLLLFFYLSFFHYREMVTTGIGKAVMFFIGMIYVVRAAEEFFFSGYSVGSGIFAAILTAVGLLYLIPLYLSLKKATAV